MCSFLEMQAKACSVHQLGNLYQEMSIGSHKYSLSQKINRDLRGFSARLPWLWRGKTPSLFYARAWPPGLPGAGFHPTNCIRDLSHLPTTELTGHTGHGHLGPYQGSSLSHLLLLIIITEANLEVLDPFPSVPTFTEINSRCEGLRSCISLYIVIALNLEII